MIVPLQDLGNSTFRFYLENKFRTDLFNQLKKKYKDWRLVAKVLGINTRHLFGFRRGWELRNGRKLLFLINAKVLGKIAKILNIPLFEIQNNITHVKHGQTGSIAKIKLPLTLNIKKIKINSIEGAIYDYVYFKNYLKILDSKFPIVMNSEEFVIEPKITSEYINNLYLRGLRPKIEKNILSYRIPGTNKIKEIFIPPKLKFDKMFAKQFGKWIGDRCGGERKIGVANKDYIFVKEFEDFIKKVLEQKNCDFYLTCNKNFKPSSKLKKLANDNIKISQTQYGDYAFRAEIPNAFLRREVFDFIENNLLSILLNSEKEIRYAYYAGLIEAEGSVNKDGTITIAFGASLDKPRPYFEFQEILKKAAHLHLILKRDGFNPRLSRKVSNTDKTNTLKYDINLLTSNKTRLEQVKFINGTISPYITYKEKLEKLTLLEAILEKKKIKIEEVQPVVNIGLVGLY